MTSTDRVLVVEQEHDAGPEMFQEWLTVAGVEVDLWRPYAGEAVPKYGDHGGLIVLGGSMGVTDDEAAPWLAQVRAMLAGAVTQELPVLGICLGAQLLALACGGRVEPSHSGGELGLGKIELNGESRRDRLFTGISSPVEAAQWHHDDITELPRGAVLLGSSPRCEIQAYRLGDRAWGVQFHPEVSAGTLEAWAATEGELPVSATARMEIAISEVKRAESRLFECWQGFAQRFAHLVQQG